MAGKILTLYKNQNYDKIKDECLKNEELFQDEYFKFDVEDAIWQRPGEICDDPRFFVDGASRFDAVQGKTADCWLVVAMANLTLIPTIFNHVVPKEQSFKNNYAGVFHFRIWQCGKWVDVVVDDRLPTRRGKLVYTRSIEKNEFWSALLEKAYAKLYGSYNYLTVGWFCEGIVDFTGGIVERVFLNPAPDNLGKILLTSLKKNSSMCCFAKSNPKVVEEVTSEGLVKGHAYSVTKVQYVTRRDTSEQVLLVRLRNPWGKQEWKGAWSDNSPEWNAIPYEEKMAIGLVYETDGEFWISLSDFVRNFSGVEICHLSPMSMALSPTSPLDIVNKVVDGEGAKTGWEENAFNGEWIQDITAGGLSLDTFSMNPQYRITLVDTDDDEDDLCTVIIALMQRNKTRQVWHRIGFKAFYLDEPKNFPNWLHKDYLIKNFETAFSSPYSRTREIVVRDRWKPGVYCIIPSTHNPDLEGKYLLRVFSEKKARMEEHVDFISHIQTNLWFRKTSVADESAAQTAEELPSSSEPYSKTIRKLVFKTDQEIKKFFNKLAGRNKDIGWQGLQSVLQYALNKESIPPLNSSDPNARSFSNYECRVLLATLDDDHSGRLSFGEFQALWRNIRRWESAFLNSSKDTEYVNRTELKQALTSAGHRVSSSQLGSMLRRYADDEGKLTFQDFIMCAVELETES